MKHILYFILLFNCFVGFSQTEKVIHGTILSNEVALPAIDIVNMSSKKSAKTDSDGRFKLSANVGDELFIISKDYTDRKIILTQEQFNQNNFIFYLEEKPIELDDVNIVKVESMKIKTSQADIDEIKLKKQQNALKVPNVYTGEIENGVDFIRLGKEIGKLFKNKEKSKNQLPPIEFKDYISTNFDNVFFVEELELKPEEINSFISFCERDTQAKTISENQNLLETMDFLINKNEDFKKAIDTNK